MVEGAEVVKKRGAKKRALVVKTRYRWTNSLALRE
jgi:hypothetical protein